MRWTFLDMMEKVELADLREKIEEKDECEFGKTARETKEELCAELNEKQKKILDHFELAVENKLDYVYYCVQAHLLNRAFRLGMEMQSALDEEDDE